MAGLLTVSLIALKIMNRCTDFLTSFLARTNGMDGIANHHEGLEGTITS